MGSENVGKCRKTSSSDSWAVVAHKPVPDLAVWSGPFGTPPPPPGYQHVVTFTYLSCHFPVDMRRDGRSCFSSDSLLASYWRSTRYSRRTTWKHASHVWNVVCLFVSLSRSFSPSVPLPFSLTSPLSFSLSFSLFLSYPLSVSLSFSPLFLSISFFLSVFHSVFLSVFHSLKCLSLFLFLSPFFLSFSILLDANQQHIGSESNALPTEPPRLPFLSFLSCI